MSSTRLPGKVLLDLGGKPILLVHLERLSRSDRIDQLVVATTIDPEDDPIVDFCDRYGFNVFRGPRDDVLERFAGCHEMYGGDIVVRVTSDCPLIDPCLTDQVIDRFLTSPNKPDYMNIDLDTFPRGLDTEVFWAKHLQTARQHAQSPHEREHVTPYLYTNHDRFNMELLPNPEPAPYRWCVDEKLDLELVRMLYSETSKNNPHFTWQDCSLSMQRHPEWATINTDVFQRSCLSSESSLNPEPMAESK